MAIQILKHQYAFLQSDAVHTGLVAGFGAGKSISATLKTIEKKKLYPGIDVAYYLPTYSLIRDIAFGNFTHYLREAGVPFVLNKTDKEFVTPIGRIVLRSTDNPASIVGYEVGYSVIDEADIPPKQKMTEVFVNIVARNRKQLPNGDINSLDLVSTPEGFNFMYDFFIKNKTDNRVLIKAKTKDNPFLPDSYIETLSEIYTGEQLKAYLEGEFINLTGGTVYYKFDRAIHNTEQELPDSGTLHIGMDFNVTNMNAVFHVLKGNVGYAVDEIVGVYDTPSMIEEIQERYPSHRIVVYPDASGKARSTSGSSDHDLLKKARFIVKSPNSNPRVKDRVNVVNASLMDAKRNTRYFVNVDKCPQYTEALEKQSYKNGIPDKEGGFDHINEAGGYFIWGTSGKKTFRMNAG